MNFAERIYGEQKNYVDRVEDALTKAFWEVMKEEKPDLAGKLEQVITASQIEDVEARRDKFQEIMGEFDPNNEAALQEQQALLNAEAIYSNIRRKARKFAATELSEARDVAEPSSADSLVYVLKKFKEESVPADQVQQLLDERALAEFSMTWHPTQPQSGTYITAGLKLDKLLENSDGSKDELKNVLKEMVNAPYTGEKKTTESMVKEAIDVLNIIYDAATEQRDTIGRALQETGYAAEGVALSKPALKINLWHAGDGDGNPNADAEALRYAIAELKDNMKQRYSTDLAEIEDRLRESELTELADQTKDIAAKVQEGAYDSNAAFVSEVKEFFETVRQGGDVPAREMANDLSYRAETFGLSGATIDIRHNALDLTAALAEIANKAGMLVEAGYMDVAAFEQAMAENPQDVAGTISAWMSNEITIGKLQDVDPESLENATAQRIFERLKIIGENPEMSDKLIIAENESAGHSLAAMAMLKISGNKVAEEGASMSVTPLTESVPDLLKLADNLEAMLKDETYREHVKQMGNTMTVMIAKSDTVRQSGMAAVDAQEEAIGKAVVLAAKYGIEVNIFVGGGEDLTRDGGNQLSQNPHYVNIAVARAIMNEICEEKGGPDYVPTNEDIQQFIKDNNLEAPHVLATVQGHGMETKFSGQDVAEYTLNTVAAQNMYGAAQATNVVPFRNGYGADKAEREKILTAMDDGKMGFAAGVEAYEKFKVSGDIDAYGRVGMTFFTNKAATSSLSNRPAKRGQIVADRELIAEGKTTIEDIKGSKQDFYANRAIFVARLAANSGTYLTGYLGQLETLTKIAEDGKASEKFVMGEDGEVKKRSSDDERGVDNLKFTYDNNKTFRDYVNRMAEIQAMVDFDHAWQLMGTERPGEEKIQAMAQEYAELSGKRANGKEVEIKPELTLAMLEDTAMETAKLTYRAATGKEAGDDFSLNSTLQEIKPELARRMEDRQKDYSYAEFVQEEVNRWANKRENQSVVVDEALFDLAVTIYAAADGRNVHEMSRNFISSDPNKQRVSEEMDRALEVPSALSDYVGQQRAA